MSSAIPQAAKRPNGQYEMPVPPPVVVWRNAPGGEPNYAIVTKYGRHAVSLMIFPPESRVGVPKDGVRFIDDPHLRLNALTDSGIWEYTDETKLIQDLKSRIAAFTK